MNTQSNDQYNGSAVAKFLTKCIDASTLSQKIIAQALGLPMPNVITMLKQGRMKLPLDRVGSMAHALKVDPVHLYRLCMEEYQPDTWEAIKSDIIGYPVTKNERSIIDALRVATLHSDPAMTSQAAREQLAVFTNTLQITQTATPVKKPDTSGNANDNLSNSSSNTVHAERITVTQGNLNNSHLYLRSILSYFPRSVIGGSNRQSQADSTLHVEMSDGTSFETDIDGKKGIFRDRANLRRYYKRIRIRAGESILIEWLSLTHVRLSPVH